MAIIQNGVWGHTFNVCSNQHPLRREFYPEAARCLGLDEPTFLPETGITGKTVDSSLVRSLVPYEFKHDNVLAALDCC
jgi:hypothetical protein